MRVVQEYNSYLSISIQVEIIIISKGYRNLETLQVIILEMYSLVDSAINAKLAVNTR